MTKTKIKFIFMAVFVVLTLICINNNSKAATFSISSNASTVKPGESFKITLKTNGAGYVNLSPSNCSVESTYIWLDSESVTLTCTTSSEGRATVSASAVIADYTTGEDERKSGSTSVNVEKPAPAPTPTPEPEPEPEPEPTQTTSTPTTTTKKETTKTETKKEEKEEEPEVYINSITLKGIKESGEEITIPLSSEFKENDYEYLCTIPGDVLKLIVEKDAGEYTDNIIVEGIDELKEGENIITLTLSVEDYKAKKYTITATKEPKPTTVEEKVENTIETISTNIVKEEKIEEKNEPVMICMPVWAFVLLIIGIVVLEFIIVKVIPFIIKIKKH